MNKKQILRSITFLCVLLFVLYQLCDLFERENTFMTERYRSFVNFEDDTIDAVMLGTSGVDRYWIAAKAYEEYGITVYPLSTDGEPSWLVIDMLKEAEKQKPDLYIFDVRPFLNEYNPEKEKHTARSRDVIDTLNFFSPNRFDAIKRSMEAIKYIEGENAGEVDELSYLLTFIQYHTRWEEESFSFSELENNESKYAGFYMLKDYSIKTSKKVSAGIITDEREPLTILAEESLIELLDYCEDQNYNIMFLATPNELKETEAKRINTLCDILDSRGIPYYNDSIIDENIYNVKTDFYNEGHVNYYGAEKFTEYFSEYLVKNYDLPDHRNDPDVKKDWDGAYDNIKETIKKWEEEKADKEKD